MVTLSNYYLIRCYRYAVVKKDHLMDIKASTSYETAAAIPEVWLTAYLLLELANLNKNDSVLVKKS